MTQQINFHVTPDNYMVADNNIISIEWLDDVFIITLNKCIKLQQNVTMTLPMKNITVPYNACGKQYSAFSIPDDLLYTVVSNVKHNLKIGEYELNFSIIYDRLEWYEKGISIEGRTDNITHIKMNLGDNDDSLYDSLNCDWDYYYLGDKDDGALLVEYFDKQFIVTVYYCSQRSGELKPLKKFKILHKKYGTNVGFEKFQDMVDLTYNQHEKYYALKINGFHIRFGDLYSKQAAHCYKVETT